MEPESWSRIEQIFHAALEQPAGRRDAFLEKVCDAPALRRQVRVLLHNAAAADAYFADLAKRAGALPVTGETAPPARPEAERGRRVGSYLLERELGRGGSSVVYLARRADGSFERHVAVKLLRTDRFSSDVRRRFAKEQQVLAELEHPNIARLYDGGIDDGARPYFVMEYVEGVPIDRYCEEKELTLESRLQLFMTVAEAVQYAHNRLIIHRDLKPANIFVTAAGEVKLLDFGLAEVLHGDDSSEADVLASLPWMTPAYAAPEQVRGERVTAATDVYQLGVVLYELLTGSRPLPIADEASSYAVARAMCEVKPRPPSSSVGRQSSSIRGRPQEAARCRTRRLLRGDLDAIVSRALERTPEKRYTSADAFVNDLKRHLENLPIAARNATLSYRARKFVSRHRVSLAACASGIILLSGLGVFHTARIAAERDHARVEAQKEKEVTHFMLDLFEAGRPKTFYGDDVTVDELLDHGVARAGALAGHPAVQAQMLTTIGLANHRLGHRERARVLFEEALAIRRMHLGAHHPDVAMSLSHLAWVRLETLDYTESRRLFEDALEIQRMTIGTDHPHFASNLHGLGLILNGEGNPAAAESALREALRLRRAVLGSRHPEVANSLNDLGIVVGRRGRLQEAEVLLEDALALRRTLLGSNHPQVAATLKFLASLRASQGDYARADSLYRESLSIWRGTLGEDHPITRDAQRRLDFLHTSPSGAWDDESNGRSAPLKQRIARPTAR